jgi:hypothetical protein
MTWTTKMRWFAGQWMVDLSEDNVLKASMSLDEFNNLSTTQFLINDQAVQRDRPDRPQHHQLRLVVPSRE